MSVESQGFDPYDVVLADLRAKRDQIDQAIKAIESVRAGGPSSSAQQTPKTNESSPVDEPGAFLGMSIADAARKLLAARKRAMNNSEILASLTAGGLVMNSADPLNTIGAVITRRFKDVGDIVKVGRGVWGLKEWYPNRSFKVASKDAEQPSRAAALAQEFKSLIGESKNGTSEPEQPSSPPPSAART